MRNRVFVLLHVNLEDPNPYSATGVVGVFETTASLIAGITRQKRYDLQTLYEADSTALPSDPEGWTEARVKGAWNAFFKKKAAYRYESVIITAKIEDDEPEGSARHPVFPRFMK